MTLNYQELDDFVSRHAAIRRRQKLQPAGGPGDKIFPPTYPGDGKNDPPRHVFEVRRVPGQKDGIVCVLIDSVQSQANRMEEALVSLIYDEDFKIPRVTVDFSDTGLNVADRISSLDAPHRIYDAILRDSLLDDVPFLKSPLGEALIKAKPAEAAALLSHAPTALLFGAWHSQGQGGGLGAKFQRSLTSEIIGINVPAEEMVNRQTGEFQGRSLGKRTGSRMDPLGIRKGVEIYKTADGWVETAQKGAKKSKPSEANHGNIAPSIQPLGVTCDYAEQVVLLSTAGLRRLRFGTPEQTRAGRSLLASLGLVAFLAQDRNGFSLRSRCDLVPDGGLQALELVHHDGMVKQIDLDLDQAIALYDEAADKLRTTGVGYEPDPVMLKPQDKLISIIRQSEEMALKDLSDEAEDE
ncbi:MAG: type I-U CRISPR-associated protein Cas7 [Alphaproteobacteria bacterium]|nr:type I-U CRISPR-associated protein Cas7 [Alphaproteobacteria bacterium]MAS48436.1 type I-U CRISPR-associated protein Cas7 [Alphaproteobacteria bacterium]MAX96306.1 type I-U CRISPR-associated protein Cas7 [Alphaproteobacteria bacterium]MBN53990.1 type I-U CRISPR-associated protein Cas7 [Alphaproteobacteria bacterium]OUT39102.1 MAG: type I-U CRISPR-associated protein Cas7 [Micavibrio sp. TMED2]|tara:strand:+ start:2740 stop:3966 length:1227 start_codon:yes stop_codon:yes gene_type:complete